MLGFTSLTAVGFLPDVGKATQMGTLFYGARRTAIEMDDQTLAHLQMVAITKLRRNEPFAVSWRDDPKVGDGRSTIWITSSTDLHFKYAGSRPPIIEKERLEEMAAAAHTTLGVHLDVEASLAEPPRH
jgi:hypothetical protein